MRTIIEVLEAFSKHEVMASELLQALIMAREHSLQPPKAFDEKALRVQCCEYAKDGKCADVMDLLDVTREDNGFISYMSRQCSSRFFCCF